MKKMILKLGTLTIIAAFLFSCGNQPKEENLVDMLLKELSNDAPQNTLAKSEQDNGWKLLFDGSTTTGWRGYNMDIFPDCWDIEDGCLTMNTIGGAESQDIITDKIYKNFALSVDYKIAPEANSGVLFQIKEDPIYEFPYETGPEVQIIDDEGWPGQLEEWQKSGANYAMYTASEKAYKPVGEWNNLVIIVNDNKVTQILNGIVVVEYVKYSDEWNVLRNSGKWANFPDYGKYDEGHISLQNHGSKVWFRNIKLKEL